MKGIRDVLGRLFVGLGKAPPRGTDAKERPPANAVTAHAQPRFGRTYEKGDFIGHKYKVYGVLGRGGFGIVYLVYSHDTNSVYALKTFREEFLANEEARNLFRKEAKTWVDLERHPYLVRAYWVEEVSGRLYIAMECIAPNDRGLTSLQDHLKHGTLDLAQILRWSIQFCHGMEYAYSKGIRCHRDIKPGNILIGQDETLKISDFGLAGVLGYSRAVSGINLSLHGGSIRLSGQTVEGIGFGTPTHMPPEQFINAAACDERSDIYSFGVVLYQMATGGELPFLAPLPSSDSEHEAARFWRAMHRLQTESPIPKLDSSLLPVIEHCLRKEPGRRYQAFHQLRDDLEVLLKRETGQLVKPPALKELEAWEWNNKGMSLCGLGLVDEAIRHFDRSLQLDPLDVNAWNNKGAALLGKGRYQDALPCFQKAVELKPDYASPYHNMGLTLAALGNVVEALNCYEKALELAPHVAGTWVKKGDVLRQAGRFEDAPACYKEAVSLKPKPRDLAGWIEMGNLFLSARQTPQAIHCFDQVLSIDGNHWKAWRNKGLALVALMEYRKALECLSKTVTLKSHDPAAWYYKALAEDQLGMDDSARSSYSRSLSLNNRRVGEPRLAWFDGDWES